MEGKAALMVESSRLGQQIDELESNLASLEAAIRDIPRKAQQDKEVFVQRARKEFEAKNQADCQAIEEATVTRRESVEELIDSFPGMEAREIAGRFEIRELEDHLMTVYPPDLIADYVCLNPIEIADDTEAYTLYTSVEGMVAGLQRGNISASIFSALSNMMNKAADIPEVGMKAGLIVFGFILLTLFISPFTLLTVFSILGITSAVHGAFVRRLLRRLYSVKLYLNESYDEDVFVEDKGDILASVDSFFDEVKAEALEEIASRVFSVDDNDLQEIDKAAELETTRLQSQMDLKKQQLETCRQGLAKVLEQLDELAEADKKRAEAARQEYLGSIQWKDEWMSQMFVEVTSENQIKGFNYAKGNSLYYGRDIEKLKQFSRLIMAQTLLHMSPNIVSNIVLDYKYNGGSLTQFSRVAQRCCKLCFSDADIEKQESSITLRIRTRTNNILSTCESIEAYNEIMAQYNSPGEYYVVVHVFGISKLTTQFVNNILNGPRVGVFYKFYLTSDELVELKSVFPLDSMIDFFEVMENPIPRHPRQVRRLFDVDT